MIDKIFKLDGAVQFELSIRNTKSNDVLGSSSSDTFGCIGIQTTTIDGEDKSTLREINMNDLYELRDFLNYALKE